METLKVRNLDYDSKKRDKFQFESINSISRTFTFGRSYLLDGWPWDGGETLSRIIGGVLKQDYGTLLKNGMAYSVQEQQKEAWCVSLSQIKVNRFSFAAPTIQQQIQHGLKTTASPYFVTEEDYVQYFHLTPERYQRRMHQLSNEGWRASCAIGLANGRRIFCFPYLRPDFINEYLDLWLKEMLDLLKRTGALVLVPTTAIGVHKAQYLCDEITPVKWGFTEV